MSNFISRLFSQNLNFTLTPSRVDRRRRRRAEEYAAVLASIPDPLPSERPSNLSSPFLPGDDTTSGWEGDNVGGTATATSLFQASSARQQRVRTHGQEQSILFNRLPPEIRQRIFAYVLGGYEIRFVHKGNRILGRVAFYKDDDDDDDGNGHSEENKNNDNGDGTNRNDRETDTMTPSRARSTKYVLCPFSRAPSTRSPSPSGSTSVLPLLQSCRAIYIEAHQLLYTSNTFAFASPLPLIYLHDRPLILNRHFHLLRRVQVEWYWVADPAGVVNRVHAPWDAETWRRAWEILALWAHGQDHDHDHHHHENREQGESSSNPIIQNQPTILNSLPSATNPAAAKRHFRKSLRAKIDIDASTNAQVFGDDGQGAEWVQCMLQVHGLADGDVEISWQRGAWNTDRLDGLESRVRQAWFGVDLR